MIFWIKTFRGDYLYEQSEIYIKKNFDKSTKPTNTRPNKNLNKHKCERKCTLRRNTKN